MYKQDTYEEKLFLVKDLIESYDYLKEAIEEYHFRVDNKRETKGVKQNTVTTHIISELETLTPYLMKSLIRIDEYLEKDSKKEEDFEKTVIQKLENWIEKTRYQKELLLSKEESYFDVWKEANIEANYKERSKEINKELGKRKDIWRKTRNDSCRIALNTIKEITLLDSEIQKKEGTKGEFKERLSFNSDIKRIEKGPNYYCYLNEEEKEDMKKDRLIQKIKSYKRPSVK